jgi:MOSC domain-containing protein YiiM
MEEGRVLAVCISERKGERKKAISSGLLVENFGLQGDAHAGDWHRQISLLGDESVDKMRAAGLDVGVGDFAENLTIVGINLPLLPIGTQLRVGSTALLEVTQIGKECHQHCAIYQQVGDCVMPREGIFARVLRGGPVAKGDAVSVVAAKEES